MFELRFPARRAVLAMCVLLAYLPRLDTNRHVRSTAHAFAKVHTGAADWSMAALIQGASAAFTRIVSKRALRARALSRSMSDLHIKLAYKTSQYDLIVGQHATFGDIKVRG